MTMRPLDFAFTSAAMRSIICTDGCVPATTSPQRIVTCCAFATAGAASASVNAMTVLFTVLSSLGSRRVVRANQSRRCLSF